MKKSDTHVQSSRVKMKKGRKWEDSVRRLLLKFRQEMGVEPRGRQRELEEMLAGQDPRCELPAWAFAPSPMRRVHLCPMLSPSSLPRTSAFQTLLTTTWLLPCCCPPPNLGQMLCKTKAADAGYVTLLFLSYEN